MALTAEAADYVVYITLTVGEDGRVRDVMPSLTRPMLPHPFEEAFLEAGYLAVSRWELEQARQVYWQRVPGGDDQYLRTETVAERIELNFHYRQPAGIEIDEDRFMVLVGDPRPYPRTFDDGPDGDGAAVDW